MRVQPQERIHFNYDYTKTLNMGGGGMPSKKFKRIKKEELPQPFDLSLVHERDVTYLPGGIDRALIEAARNRHHAFRGVAWGLGGEIKVLPGDWLHLNLEGQENWWLVYSADHNYQVIVSQGGGYRLINKNTFACRTLNLRHFPPWESIQ